MIRKPLKVKPPKPKKCGWSECQKMFTPRNSFQKTCYDYKCAAGYAKEQQAKKEAKERKEKRRENKKALLELNGRPAIEKILQPLVNEYVRLRDKDLPCISCGTRKPYIKYDAGHCFSVGAYPNLRYHLDNIHKQCSNNCNMNKSGNQAAYLPRLLKRIGQERYDQLMEDKNKTFKPSIPELKTMIEYFRAEIKKLKQE